MLIRRFDFERAPDAPPGERLEDPEPACTLSVRSCRVFEWLEIVRFG